MGTSKKIRQIRLGDQIFETAGWFFLIAVLGFLLFLLGGLFVQGWRRLTPEFFSNFSSRFPQEAGVHAALVGSFIVIFLTLVFATPVGILTGLYLEEYAPRNRFTQFLELNILTLAGVPSIVYGLLGLGFFVYVCQFGASVLTASLTLALLILPIVIVSTRESVKLVPKNIREAAFALGATRTQMVLSHLLPYSFGGILTGIIIATARALGETAPLIAIGGVTFISFLPKSVFDAFTVMPIQMYDWISRPQSEFHVNAALAGSILIVMTFVLNALAISYRKQFRRKFQWH